MCPPSPVLAPNQHCGWISPFPAWKGGQHHASDDTAPCGMSPSKSLPCPSAAECLPITSTFLQVSVALSPAPAPWHCSLVLVRSPRCLLSVYSPLDASQSTLLLRLISKAVRISFSSSILQGSISNAPLKSGCITSSVWTFIH